MYQQTIRVGTRECPTSCTLCAEACASCHEDGIARIDRFSIPGLNADTVYLCNQCSNAECVAICPTGALKRTDSGAVQVSADACIGCGLCSLACRYGGIFLNAKEKKSVKCDRCLSLGTAPKCVEACPHGILVDQDAEKLVSSLSDDILTNGTPYCGGCMMEFLARFTLRVLGKDIVLVGSPSCGILGGRCGVSSYGALMTNACASLTGLTRYYRKIGKDVTCVAICGDGATADIAFQGLSAAAERGERFLYICYDNEAYMNTGIQRSGTTPQFAWTTTTRVGPKSRGKQQEPKNIPLLMAMHTIPFTATASLAYMDDYAEKLREGARAARHGLAYLHVVAPCPTGWRGNPADGFEFSRMAVETNYAPLWKARYGKFRMTHEVREPRPVSDYLKMTKRFEHLTPEEVEAAQRYVNKRYAQIETLARAFPDSETQ